MQNTYLSTSRTADAPPSQEVHSRRLEGYVCMVEMGSMFRIGSICDRSWSLRCAPSRNLAGIPPPSSDAIGGRSRDESGQQIYRFCTKDFGAWSRVVGGLATWPITRACVQKIKLPRRGESQSRWWQACTHGSAAPRGVAVCSEPEHQVSSHATHRINYYPAPAEFEVLPR